MQDDNAARPALAQRVFELAKRHGVKLATAESCTGGMIAAALTDIAGSSAVFDRGFVTYSNEAKQAMLGVRAQTLATHGAVSAETACEMARGALCASLADLAVSVTGIAGPDGGSMEKPVGLVHAALAYRDREILPVTWHFGNPGRAAVRRATVERALQLFVDALEEGMLRE